jgi:hypothetical protein
MSDGSGPPCDIAGATRSYLLKDPEVVKALGKALRTAVDNFPLNPAVLWKAMRATHLLSANGGPLLIIIIIIFIGTSCVVR